MYKMGSILITGGAGFIGKHLIERLLDEGYRILVVDNLSGSKFRGIKNLPYFFDFVKGDITNINLMKKLIKKCDLVFHLAAVSRVLLSLKNPMKCIETNILGTEIVARLCSKLNKKIIFSSSREVYGNAIYLPVDEIHPLNPCNLYGITKMSAENIIKTYSRCYGLNYVILRIANVFGEGDVDGVVSTFVMRSFQNKNLIVYGKSKILDFIYIDDVIESLIRSIELSENSTLNIGSGIGMNLLNLAKLIKNITKSNSKIIIKKKREWEVEKFVANIEKAYNVLNWRPKTDFKTGLKQLIEAFKAYLIL